MMRNVLQQLTTRLATRPRHQRIQQVTGLSCPPLAWVDDVAIPFASETPAQLDDEALQVLAIVHEVFTAFGLTLNLSAGKTEAVLHYRGAGSATQNEVTFVEHFGHVPIPETHPMASHQTLRVVSDYGYLGTVFSQTAKLAHELRTRVGKAQLVYRQLRKSLFTNRRLSVKARLHLLHSLVLSIVMHGSGNWPLLSHQQYKWLSHVIVGWHRAILGKGFWSEDNVSDLEVLAQSNSPPLSIRLMKHRLLYAFQWVESAPQVAIDYITADDVDSGSWFSALREAITWFQSMHSSIDESIRTTEEVLDWLHRHRRDGPKKVRNAVRRFCLQQCTIQEVVQGHRRIFQWCTEHGAIFAPLEGDNALPGEYPCDLCSRTFHSAQALQGHRWRWHNVFSEERRYVYDAICRGCGQCWWTPQRLQQHLRYSRKQSGGCFDIVRRYYAPLQTPVKFHIPHDLQHVHRLPKCQVAGPMQEQLVPLWRQRQLAKLQELFDIGKEKGYALLAEDEQCHATDEAFTSATIRWAHASGEDTSLGIDDLQLAWQDVVLKARTPTDPEGLMALFHWGRTCMYDLVQTEFGDNPDVLTDVEAAFLEIAEVSPAWQWLCDVSAVHGWREPHDSLKPSQSSLPAAPRKDLEHYVDMILHQEQLLKPYTRRLCKFDMQRSLPIYQDQDGHRFIVVLHLFSGRRRDGDCVHWAEVMSHDLMKQCGVSIRVLSVDTAIHGQCGDLDVGENFSRLLQLAARGLFAASLSGPPCETWSAARNLLLDEAPNRRAPRPLRTALQPWGVECRSCRELEQTRVGSRLMLNSLHLDTAVVYSGGSSLMEHPDIPRDPSFASVWRTSLHRNLIAELPNSTEHHIQQWRYGSISVKPTLLRAIGFRPAMTWAVLRAHELPDAVYPSHQLGGRDNNGHFKTAAAKEYPEQLCKCLVAIVQADALHRISTGNFHVTSFEVLAPDELEWMQKLLHAGSNVCHSQWLPDYQPHV